MTAVMTASTANPTKSAWMAAAMTCHLAKKPTKTGMPASENMIISIISAYHGLRLARPLKSSRFSASMPLPESRIITAKAPADIIA